MSSRDRDFCILLELVDIYDFESGWKEITHFLLIDVMLIACLASVVQVSPILACARFCLSTVSPKIFGIPLQ